MRRDLALLVDSGITAGQIENCIRGAAGELLQNFRLFDVYRGEELPVGKKSIAVGLEIGDRSKTLEDAQIDNLISHLLRNLAEQLDAHLRD